MKRLRLVIALVVTMLAVPALSFAQAKKGDTEVLIFGNLSSIHSTGSTSTSGTFFLNGGKFTTDLLEIGGGPTVSISTSSVGKTSSTDFTLGGNAFVRRYFSSKNNPKIQPYLGLELQVTDFAPEGQNFTDAMFAQAIGGVKNYLSEKAAIDFKGSFGLSPKHPGDFQLFAFQVGLTYVF